MASILEKELSYKLLGALYDVRNKYGRLYKEEIYHNACKEIFEKENILYKSHPRIKILSLDTGKQIGTYIPDFLIGNKILVELKSQNYLPKDLENQLIQYLKASKYEIGYIVNFGSKGKKLDYRRRIYTNDRKSHISY